MKRLRSEDEDATDYNQKEVASPALFFLDLLPELIGEVRQRLPAVSRVFLARTCQKLHTQDGGKSHLHPMLQDLSDTTDRGLFAAFGRMSQTSEFTAMRPLLTRAIMCAPNLMDSPDSCPTSMAPAYAVHHSLNDETHVRKLIFSIRMRWWHGKAPLKNATVCVFSAIPLDVMRRNGNAAALMGCASITHLSELPLLGHADVPLEPHPVPGVYWGIMDMYAPNQMDQHGVLYDSWSALSALSATFHTEMAHFRDVSRSKSDK